MSQVCEYVAGNSPVADRLVGHQPRWFFVDLCEVVRLVRVVHREVGAFIVGHVHLESSDRADCVENQPHRVLGVDFPGFAHPAVDERQDGSVHLLDVGDGLVLLRLSARGGGGWRSGAAG